MNPLPPVAAACWWRPITLKNSDGVFAMEIGAFKG